VLAKHDAGTTNEFKVANTAYTISGATYVKTATTGLTFTANNKINDTPNAGDYWGIWRVQIDSAGTISTKPGGGLSDQVYTNSVDAIAALPAVDASHVSLGYILIQANDGAKWTANTDNFTVGSGCRVATFTSTAIKTLPAAK